MEQIFLRRRSLRQQRSWPASPSIGASESAAEAELRPQPLRRFGMQRHGRIVQRGRSFDHATLELAAAALRADPDLTSKIGEVQ